MLRYLKYTLHYNYNGNNLSKRYSLIYNANYRMYLLEYYRNRNISMNQRINTSNMGDMVSIRGIFSQEANKEAEGLIYTKRNLLGSSGDNIRTKGKEAILTLYALTKD